MSSTAGGGARGFWITILRGAALALFALAAVLSVAAVRLAIGPIPVRLIVLALSGACIAAADPARFLEALRGTGRVVAIISGIAVLGVVVSLIAAADPALVFRQVFEIHVQAIMTVIIAYALMLRFGLWPVLLCFLGAYALSAVFALAQAAGFDFAWRARAIIGALMKDPLHTILWYYRRERPLGLSFSPVHFGTQSCLALIAIFFARLDQFKSGGAPRIDWVLIGAIAVLALLCVATGNRSPLLGFLAFVLVYFAVRAPGATLAALPLLLGAAVLAPFALDLLSDAGVRVAETSDGSSAGRATLRAYGFYLMQERPIGYGLTFDSTDYWQGFAHEAIYMENWLSFRQWPVHNYYLNVLAKYGVLVLAVVPLIAPRNRTQLWLWFPYLPYLVHAFYHNDGPMQGDFLFFMVLPAALLLSRRLPVVTEPDEKTRERPWKRAFAR